MFELIPDGEPCTLAECPPGLFAFGDFVGLKNEYGEEINGRRRTAAYNEAGEFWWGGVSDLDERAALIVQPLGVNRVFPQAAPK